MVAVSPPGDGVIAARWLGYARSPGDTGVRPRCRVRADHLRRSREHHVGSVIKKRRKRMAKKKHRKLLKKTRVQRRNKK